MGVKVRKPKGRRSWCVVIDYHGQRKLLTVGSREAAERVKREIEVRLAVGGVEALEPEKPLLPLLREYAQEWLKNVEHERKPSTAGFYEQYLRLYVLPRFGELQLATISRENIKRFIADLRTKGLAKNTIRLALTTLRAVLNGAIEDSYLKQNPAQGLGRFVKSEKPKREATSLTTKEVNQLLRFAEQLTSRDYALLLTALRAGLREGELAGLKWGDIQFGQNEYGADRYITVQRSYDRRWSRTMLTPKSRKGRRVDMSRQLRETLLKLRDQRLLSAFAEGKSDISDDLVFPSDAGTPIEMNNFSQRVFKPLLASAGLRTIRFHDLRHTFGSLLIQTGASLPYVKDQMGHSSIQVTVDIYGHLIPGANISFVDRLDGPTSPRKSATPAQQDSEGKFQVLPEVLGNEWLGGRDSNPDTQIQSLQSYH